MARLAGVEPTTFWSVAKRSNPIELKAQYMEVTVRFELTNTKVAASDLTAWLSHHKYK